MELTSSPTYQLSTHQPMFGKRKPEELSVEELERLLLVKRRQARLQRYQQVARNGGPVVDALFERPSPPPPAPPAGPPSEPGTFSATGIRPPTARPSGWRRFFSRRQPQAEPASPPAARGLKDSLLLGLEVSALLGLVAVLVASYLNLQELNTEAAIAQQSAVQVQVPPTPTPTPPISLARLPGGHSSPTSAEGAVPDVPPHLQKWVQPKAAGRASPVNVAIEQERQPPTRIVIPKINVDAPVVPDITWEALKKGVGHLPGSAYPGERGNMYLAAHNDIFGEIFRYLHELEPGDEFFVYAGEEQFRYVVREKRIIEPTDVEVMYPTTEPVATLQTCYPYLIDTHRLVVIAELAE